MAVKYWVGTVSGTFATGGNWHDAAAPVAGDSLVFTSGYTNALTAGDYSATAYAAIEIGAGYLADFGSSATWMEFDTDKITINAQMTNCYIKLQNGNANADIEINILNTATPSDLSTTGLHLMIRGAANDNGNIKTIKAGYVQWDGGDLIAVYSVGGQDVRIESATGSPDVTVLGGALKSKATLDEAYNNGGEFTLDSAAAIATLWSFDGTYYHNSTGGITTKCWGMGGQLNFDSTPRRVTIAELALFEADLSAQNALGTPAITTFKRYGSGNVNFGSPDSVALTTLGHP